MIVIIYRTNYTILAKDTYKRIEVREVGFCYLLSNSQEHFIRSKQEHVLLELLRNYYYTKSFFLVPEGLKELFVELIKKNFNDQNFEDNNYFQLYVVEGTEKTEAIKNRMIGYAKENNPLPDAIEFVEILRPSITESVPEMGVNSRMKAKEELLTLFNMIVSKDNEIDAIFVCTNANNRARIALSSAPKETRTVDIQSFAPIMGKIINALQVMKKVNPQLGAFDHLMLQHKKTGESNGSIIYITHILEYPEYSTFLLFVSATEEGIAMLELYKDRHIEQIKGLLKEYLG